MLCIWMRFWRACLPAVAVTYMCNSRGTKKNRTEPAADYAQPSLLFLARSHRHVDINVGHAAQWWLRLHIVRHALDEEE
jgi:hypothetical protein